MIHPERSGGHKRERLHGTAREKRRAEIFERAGGRCEEIEHLGFGYGKRCGRPATEWSHKQHGPRKCDCMDCGIASCSACHRKRHNAGGKPIAVTKKSLKAAV